MELTLDQALHKGIEAHKQGKVQEADGYYTAILKVQPNHPDANHNMGVLAVGVGKVRESLPFFKTALEANSSVTQFWVSYIDALIKLDQMEDAEVAFAEAKSNGAQGVGIEKLELRISPKVYKLGKKLKKNVLEKAKYLKESGKYAEAINFIIDHLSDRSKNPDLLALLTQCYILKGELTEASKQLTRAKNIEPDNAPVVWSEVRLLLALKKVDMALALAKKNHKRLLIFEFI